MENKIEQKVSEKDMKFIKTQLITGLVLAFGSILLYFLSKLN
jgi:hypothetical protein